MGRNARGMNYWKSRKTSTSTKSRACGCDIPQSLSSSELLSMRWIEESSFDVKEHLTAAVEHDGVKWLEIRCNYKFISSIVSDDKSLKMKGRRRFTIFHWRGNNCPQYVWIGYCWLPVKNPRRKTRLCKRSPGSNYS